MNWEKLLNSGRLRKSTKEEDSRNAFESDFGRTIFSAAMRRMHDKTQVFPLTADDHIHSRLTHSMEVMAIGHSLGIRVCEDENFQKIIAQPKSDLFREIPVILKNACLVHDIGNPPFGHFGETIIQNYFKHYFSRPDAIKLTPEQQGDFTLFDGNAQGFRILTKLQILNDKYGLNLTYATLGAYLKYPSTEDKEEGKIGRSKRGVFQSEKEYLETIAEECGTLINGEIVRHPLCFLMEAADSICYLVMDMEDGFNKGWFGFDLIEKELAPIEGVSDKIKKIKERLTGFNDDLTLMVHFRIYLIQRLVDLASGNFLKHIDAISDGKYNKELILDDPSGLTVALKNFCFERIFPNREITSLELTGHAVITGLLDYYIKFLFNTEKGYKKRASGLISQSILRTAFIENGLPEGSEIDDLDDYYKLRVIVDFISGMTDQFALSHYQKLSGQKIS